MPFAIMNSLNHAQAFVRPRNCRVRYSCSRPIATGIQVGPSARDPVVTLEKFIANESNDPIGILPNEPADSIFGFMKTPLETPRAVTVLSDDLMQAYGIETALDVSKIAPNTYTTSIFGIVGNVNARGVPSDAYFRGMKRSENTSCFRRQLPR